MGCQIDISSFRKQYFEKHNTQSKQVAAPPTAFPFPAPLHPQFAQVQASDFVPHLSVVNYFARHKWGVCELSEQDSVGIYRKCRSRLGLFSDCPLVYQWSMAASKATLRATRTPGTMLARGYK